MIKKNINRLFILIGWVLFIIFAFLYFNLLFEKKDITNKNIVHEKQPRKIIKGKLAKITDWYEAVGTVRPLTESVIQSQITAQVKKVLVKPGQKVVKNQKLIVLDDRQPKSRLNQAKQAFQKALSFRKQAQQSFFAAQAALKQANLNYQRIKKYFESNAATSNDLEKAESMYIQAKAGLKRAKEALVGAKSEINKARLMKQEADILLSHTTIKASYSGEILDRHVEKGDLAIPGKPLIIMQTSNTLRLEAFVREGLISKLKQGHNLKVKFDTINKTVNGIINEIVPYADPKTRTFLVKVTLPIINGLYPGMYGKLLIPEKTHNVILVNEKAILNIGQLELVKVKKQGKWKTQYVKLGKKIGNNVEIVSGLSGNEEIGIWD